MSTGQAQKAKTSCPHGHPYDAANTYTRPGTSWRECRACKRAWAERSRGGMSIAVRPYAPGATK